MAGCTGVETGAAAGVCGAAVEADTAVCESLLHPKRIAEPASNVDTVNAVRNERRKLSSKKSQEYRPSGDVKRLRKHRIVTRKSSPQKPVFTGPPEGETPQALESPSR